MHKLLIKFKNSEAMLQLFFADGAKANDAANRLISRYVTNNAVTLAPGAIFIGDDYGNQCWVDQADISGVLSMDLEGMARAGGEEALLNAREQARVNAKAQRDPAMNLARTPPGLLG